MQVPATGEGPESVRLGVAIPRLARPTAANLERALDLCMRLRVSIVEVSIDRLEAALGAPAPTVPLDPPPADGVAFGLLDLEEDVLRDAYDLAKRTFDAQVQAWRASASLAPLTRLQRSWHDGGVTIDVVSAPDLVRWADSEVDYACRVARSVGARVLSTAISLAGPRRLLPHVRRHGLRLSFTGTPAAGPEELGRLVEFDDPIAVSLDLGAWTTGRHGSPLTFLERYAAQTSHVRLTDARSDGVPISFGSGEAPIRDVLRAMRDNRWNVPAVIALDHRGDDAAWCQAVTQAVADCRTILERTT